MEKVLSEIPKGTKYMPLPSEFFDCDSLNLCVVKTCLIKRISTACTVKQVFNKLFYIYFSSLKWIG